MAHGLTYEAEIIVIFKWLFRPILSTPEPLTEFSANSHGWIKFEVCFHHSLHLSYVLLILLSDRLMECLSLVYWQLLRRSNLHWNCCCSSWRNILECREKNPGNNTYSTRIMVVVRPRTWYLIPLLSSWNFFQ